MYECLYQEQNNKKDNRECNCSVQNKMLGYTTVTVLEYITCGMHTS